MQDWTPAEAVLHGTKHVLDAYSTELTHFWQHLILKNCTILKFYCTIAGYCHNVLKWNHSYFVQSELVLIEVCLCVIFISF